MKIYSTLYLLNRYLCYDHEPKYDTSVRLISNQRSMLSIYYAMSYHNVIGRKYMIDAPASMASARDAGRLISVTESGKSKAT